MQTPHLEKPLRFQCILGRGAPSVKLSGLDSVVATLTPSTEHPHGTSRQRTPRRHWRVCEKLLRAKRKAWRFLPFLTEEARVPVRRWAPLGVGTPTPGADASSEPQTAHPVCRPHGPLRRATVVRPRPTGWDFKHWLCPNVTLAINI